MTFVEPISPDGVLAIMPEVLGPEVLLPAREQVRWHAAYTSPRHEKMVARQLGERAIDYFLPLYHTVHRWKDRRKEVELPIFPGYIFVRLAMKDRLQVLQLRGVVRFVSFNGCPAVLPAGDIDALRNGWAGHVSARSHPYLVVGRRARVKSGPFAGAQGILKRKKEGFRIVISIEAIMRSISVEVDESDVEPII